MEVPCHQIVSQLCQLTFLKQHDIEPLFGMTTSPCCEASNVILF